MKRRGTRWRDAAANLAAVLVSTAAAVLLLELGLHLATGRRYVDVDLRLLTGPLTWVPNQSQRWKRIEWDITYSINSEGFRDVEYTQPPEMESVLALGDSWTEGYGVELDQAYPKRLQALAREGGYPLRVYDAGLQGRAPSDYVKVYDALWKDRPDRKDVRLVTMGFDLATDIEDQAQSTAVQAPPPSKGLKYHVKRWLCEHSVLYNFVRRPLRLRDGGGLLKKLGLQNQELYDSLAMNRKYEDRWRYSAQFVRRFRDELRAQGRELVLILIPMKVQVEDDTNAALLRETGTDPSKLQRFGFNEFMAGFCKDNHMRCLDLLPAFREENPKEPHALYFRTDGHWSAKGQDLAGRTLFAYLKGQGLLDRLKKYR